MKICIVILLVSAFLLFSSSTAFADDPVATSSASITSKQGASMIVDSMKSFITGIDGWLGDFIFHTPDLFGDSITLSDGTNLGAITNFRNMFYLMSIPILAIVISFISIGIMQTENYAVIKPFLVRLLVVGVLLIITPSVLSYSIQANNLLVDKILTTSTSPQPQFTSFVSDYYDNVNTQLQAGADPTQFGIPSFNFSLLQNIYTVIGIIFSHLLLFLITFLFLILGILFIVFQFIMRFLSLLFLSVLFPLIIPFALSEKTQGIAISFFKSWLSYLIHQPAFVLAYMLVIVILKAALEKQGASIGMLLFYIGALFFLGSVNILATRLFGESWTALGGNIHAAMMSNMGTRPLKQHVMNPAMGAMKNRTTGFLASTLGLGAKQGNTVNQREGGATEQATPNSNWGNTHFSGENRGGETPTQQAPNSQPTTPSFTRELRQKGMTTDVIDKNQGIVQVSGEAWKHKDPATGMTSIYPSKEDATLDGVKADDLIPTKLDRAQFIDLSAFDKKPNPHNVFVTKQATQQGLKSDYAHVTPTSSPDRVKHFLELSKKRNQEQQIKGVIVKRFGNAGGERSTKRVIRFYTEDDL